MNAKEIIGKNIQRHRESLEIKQDTLASILGITPSALSQIENGKTDITVSRIEQIAIALKKNFYEIISSPNQVISVNNSPNTGIYSSNFHNTDPKLIEQVLSLMNSMTIILKKLE